ncbi:MAG: hypothetical protein HW376_902 [candidate division NC10 bacterium]|nr:hypothetical protein [candidate division NC10 bacterium]
MLPQATCDVAAALEVEEDPANCTQRDTCRCNDFPVRRVEKFWIAEQREYDSQGGRSASAASAHSHFLEFRGALTMDENVKAWCPQVSVAGSVNEMKVEFVTAVIRELGRKIGFDEHAFVAVRCELVLGRG